MKKTAMIFVLVFLWTAFAFAETGLVSVKSAHDVKATADRLEKVLMQKGMKVFVRIDHAQGAVDAGMSLRPTELIIFGNPKVGTPLMLCSQSVGIDLPQKALIWQDAQGGVWFSYNDPQYLSDRHGLADCQPVLQKVAAALAGFAKAATQP